MRVALYAWGTAIGGPILKRTLSRVAGVSLYWLGGLPTHDATNAFRAYRLSVLREIPIESSGGFEYSLEITAKAHIAGHRVTEVPSTWRDRTAGQSRFRLIEMAAPLPQVVLLCPQSGPAHNWKSMIRIGQARGRVADPTTRMDPVERQCVPCL